MFERLQHSPFDAEGGEMFERCCISSEGFNIY